MDFILLSNFSDIVSLGRFSFRLCCNWMVLCSCIRVVKLNFQVVFDVLVVDLIGLMML